MNDKSASTYCNEILSTKHQEEESLVQQNLLYLLIIGGV